MLYKTYYSQIRHITAKLIEYSLSIDQNYPSYDKKTGLLYITGNDLNLSVSMKNISYPEIYKIISEERNFNVKLIDGGILQYNYSFDKSNGKLLSHRLAYFPSPTFESYQNDPNVYESDSLYGDILKKNIVPVPVRCDFDPNKFKEVLHPISHMTLGQYENCRLAVSNHLSPYMFTEFVLKSFYNIFYIDQLYLKGIFPVETTIERCISESEKTTLHMHIETA